MLYSVIAELFLKCIWHLYSLGKFKHWKNYFFQMYVLRVIISSVPLSVWSGYFPCVKLTPNHKGDEMLFVFLSDLQIAVRFLLLSFWKHFSCFCLQQHSEGKSPQSPIGQLCSKQIPGTLPETTEIAIRNASDPGKEKYRIFHSPRWIPSCRQAPETCWRLCKAPGCAWDKPFGFAEPRQCPDLALYVTFQFPWQQQIPMPACVCKVWSS